MEHFESTYAGLKERLESTGKKGLGIDFDDSIADTNTYWAALIIDRYGHPRFSDPNEIIRAYHYVRNVSEWRTSEIEGFIDKLMRSEDAVSSIPPVEVASEAISGIERIRSIICYITGRPSTVDMASYEWLRRHNFPQREIIFQPDLDTLKQMGFQNGNEWRAGILEFLYPWIEGLLDDNEDLLRYTTGYTGRIYLLGRSRLSENPNIVFCPDWNSVVKAVKKWK